MKLAIALIAVGNLLASPVHAEVTVALITQSAAKDADAGAQARLGAELAVADLNAKGGLLGQKVRLLTAEDDCDAKQAETIAGVMQREKASLVIGHPCPTSALPASIVYSYADLVYATSAVSDSILTEGRLSNIFRLTGRDDLQGELAGSFLAEHYKMMRVAFTHDRSRAGHRLVEEARLAYSTRDGHEIFVGAVDPAQSDYSDLISRLKDENIDVLYFGGAGKDAANLVKQIRRAGLNTLLMSSCAAAGEDFWRVAGEDGQGVLFTQAPDARDAPAAKDVVKRLSADGARPRHQTLATYAVVQVWADAVEKSLTTEARRVSAVLREGTWSTALGQVSFDTKGDARQQRYAIYRWFNGKHQPI